MANNCLIQVGLSGQSLTGLVGHLKRFWVAPGKGFMCFFLPDPTFRVQLRLYPLWNLHGTEGGAGGLPPRHTAGESQPEHPPGVVLGKGLATQAVSPTLPELQRVQFPRSGVGKVSLNTRGHLHLPTSVISDSSPSLPYMLLSVSFSSVT